MTYDSLDWGEEVQNNGLLGVLGKGPSPIVFTGDTNVLRKGFGLPVMVGLGSTSDTKPAGCAIAGNRSYGAQNFNGPGALEFAGQGFMRDFARPYQEGESLTAVASNTNVSEGIVVQADIAYGSAHPYPANIGQAVAMAGGGVLHCPPIAVTSSAAVTPFSGEVALDTATTQDLWLDTRSTYHWIGVVPTISAATFGGTWNMRGLPALWNGFVPGVPATSLSDVTFTAGNAALCYEPVGPFPGDALPTIGLNSTSSGAMVAAILLVEHPAGSAGRP